jgi:ketosteroid isomerase-like protein
MVAKWIPIQISPRASRTRGHVDLRGLVLHASTLLFLIGAGAPESPADRFRHLLTTEYAAIARADSATLRARLADDLIWVIAVNGAELTRPEFLAAVGQPQVPQPSFEVDHVRVRRTGDVAVVEYRRRDRRRVGDSELSTWSRALDVFVRRGPDWLLERHTQTWLVSPVTAAVVDSASLHAFVGRYRIGPGYVDDVHWEGGRLVATASGQSRGAFLVPVSANAFSPDSVGALMVFERDSTGRVIGYVQGFPDGRVIRAPRIP